jgi:DNA-directed RNA polymerase subunit RPC12/RpoP
MYNYYCKILLTTMAQQANRRFPCPVCSASLDVRESKKRKPYVVCDPCGVQMFVRGASGIQRFESQVVRGGSGSAFDRLAEMERRYRKKCPKCGKTFWINPDLAETSWFNGELTGYKCPEKGCSGVVKPESAE